MAQPKSRHGAPDSCDTVSNTQPQAGNLAWLLTPLQLCVHICVLRRLGHSPAPGAATRTTSAIPVRTHIAQGGQLDVVSGAVLLGVVTEHCGAVEGAVVLWEVQPALETVGALPAHTNADDVGGAVGHRAAE